MLTASLRVFRSSECNFRPVMRAFFGLRAEGFREMRQDDEKNPLTTMQDALGLFAFVFACLAVSAIGGLVTASSVGGWYATLDKPVFNPPGWVFAPVWTTLYVLMAIAAWRVWRAGRTTSHQLALWVFALQLGLNLAWSVLFFGMQEIGLALLEILLLLSVIAFNTLLFWRIERLAGWLFVPYVLWVGFASVLSFALWSLN